MPEPPQTTPQTDWLGPIFRWEAISQSRRWQTYSLRVVYSSLLAIVLGCIVVGNQSDISTNFLDWISKRTMSVESRAAAYFAMIFSWLQMACVLFMTPILVAPAIASERERKTIEYLFATPLTNREIVFGKLIARGGAMLTILLAGSPILAMAGLFGGIDYSMIGMSLAASLALLFSVSTFSICVSAVTETVRRATTGTLRWIALILISPGFAIAVGMALMSMARWYGVGSWLWSIFEFLIFVSVPLWVIHPIAFWILLTLDAMVFPGMMGWSIGWLTFFFVAGQTLLGFFFLWVACVDLREAHFRQEAQEAAVKIATTTGLPKKSIPVWERWPIAWKEYRARHAKQNLTKYVKRNQTTFRRIMFRFVLVGVIIYLLFFLLRSGAERIAFEVIPTITVFAGVGAGLSAFARAQHSLMEEMSRDCLPLLLMLPASAREIIWSKALGNLLVVLRTLAWMSPIWLFSWFLGAVSLSGVLTAVIAYVGFMLLLLGLGLLTGMNQKTPLTIVVFLVVLGSMNNVAFLEQFSRVLKLVVEFLFPLKAIQQTFLDRGAGVFDPLPKLRVLGAAAVYALAGVALLEHAARRFPKYTGRIE